MPQPIVLVTFSCQNGDIESLALSAAVGAVQARALIRLRRLPDAGGLTDSDALTRMRKEYVPPAEADVIGASAIILASAPDSNPASAPWLEFLDLLRKLGNADRLRGKAGASIGGMAPLMAELGFTMIPDTPAEPLAVGHAVAQLARSIQEAL
jgi:hypothetical protein